MLSVPTDLCCLVQMHTLAVSCVRGRGGGLLCFEI